MAVFWSGGGSGGRGLISGLEYDVLIDSEASVCPRAASESEVAETVLVATNPSASIGLRVNVGGRAVCAKARGSHTLSEVALPFLATTRPLQLWGKQSERSKLRASNSRGRT